VVRRPPHREMVVVCDRSTSLGGHRISSLWICCSLSLRKQSSSHYKRLEPNDCSNPGLTLRHGRPGSIFVLVYCCNFLRRRPGLWVRQTHFWRKWRLIIRFKLRLKFNKIRNYEEKNMIAKLYVVSVSLMIPFLVTAPIIIIKPLIVAKRWLTLIGFLSVWIGTMVVWYQDFVVPTVQQSVIQIPSSEYYWLIVILGWPTTVLSVVYAIKELRKRHNRQTIK
jgi:hypothetical protein